MYSTITLWQTITFAFFFITLLSTLKRRQLWLAPFTVTLVLGWHSDLINFYGLVTSVALAICCFYAANERLAKRTRVALNVVSTLLLLVLSLHAFGLFNNIQFLKEQVVKPNSIPFSLYLNLDKAIAGLIFWVYFVQPLQGKFNLDAKIFITFFTTIVATLSGGVALGLINLESHLEISYQVVIIFAAAQIMSTCLTEEVLFRGYIQGYVFKSKPAFGIFISSALFGLVHLPAGFSYAALAGVSGLGYAVVYHLSKRIELAIACHFLLNLTHLAFFTYPIRL